MSVETLIRAYLNNNNDLAKRAITLYMIRENRKTAFVLNALLLRGPVKHTRIGGFTEIWIDQYIEEDFFQLFRMTRGSFTDLLRRIDCPELRQKYNGGEEPIPLEKQLLITLWWLGKGEVLLTVANVFNVAVASVHRCTTRLLKKLVSLRTMYIVWPDTLEIPSIAEDFRQICGFPGVIGAIDGCNVHIKPPTAQQDSYIDKNQHHSIKLQATVAPNFIMTNINVGFPGSVHDARMFRNSSLFDTTVNNLRKYFPSPHYHLVGDKAYPLLPWLLTPYKNNGNLDRRKTGYNFKHSKTRITVEHTFGILKNRWRILRYINVNSVEKAIQIIAACCVLHNFCYIHCDYWDARDPIEEDEEMYGGNENNIVEAQQKRFNISVQLENLL